MGEEEINMRRNKRFYRANAKDSMIGGVCAGVAEYFDIDPTFVRILWATFGLVYGGGIIAYLLFWIIAPRKS